MNETSLKMFNEIRPHWNWWRRAERAIRRYFRMAPSDAERLEWFQRMWLGAREENGRLLKQLFKAPAVSCQQQEAGDQIAFLQKVNCNANEIARNSPMVSPRS